LINFQGMIVMKKIFTLVSILCIVLFTLNCEITVSGDTNDNDDDDDSPPAEVSGTCYLSIDGNTRQLSTFIADSDFFNHYYLSFHDNTYWVDIDLPNPPGTSYTGNDWTSISNLEFLISASGSYEAKYDTSKIFILNNIQVNSGIISGSFSGELSNSMKTDVKTVSGSFSTSFH
jgi:hypothetical protein